MDFKLLDQYLLEALQAMTWQEVVAVLLGIVYIYFAAKENIWCWSAAIVSVLLYVYICIKANLYAETGLQFFYLAMGVYGWINWNKRKNGSNLPISWWKMKTHLLVISSGFLATMVMGYLLATYTKAALPYLDSFTTVFSIITTWMVTKKVIENWLYWIIIDGAGVYLYFQRELYLTSLLFFAYTIIVIFGFFTWRRHWIRQKSHSKNIPVTS